MRVLVRYDGPPTDLCGRPVPALLWVESDADLTRWAAVTVFVNSVGWDHVFLPTRYLHRKE